MEQDPNDGDIGTGDGANAGTEALACVSCRSRKLKCDRSTPACARCVKVKGDCVYPESRRKPTFKRRNVKELEARLAQVEGYLKDISKGKPVEVTEDDGDQDIPMQPNPFSVGSGIHTQAATTSSQSDQSLLNTPDACHSGEGQELMWLGMTETLPPLAAIEELHNAFFTIQYHQIPIIHASRYYEAFYGSPLRKPPMCLQYAIWAMGSIGTAKYDSYGDVFYKRARQYAETDEMRGDGEYFITISHAQAWVLIAAYEARRMLFTRASMSCGRSVRLAQMMGLDRLDGGRDDLPPALGPSTSWVELEERRRTFWGVFASDCHASISTGWPNLIRTGDIMTRLPCSESAFNSGQEETAPFLHEAIKGASYSSFAGTLVVCEGFKGILYHVHRPKPDDNPQDVLEGNFWKRHRELDNNLSSIFMFLPESFRLPQSQRDPAAIYANLNLHASIICLHHAALEMADKYKLSDSIIVSSKSRLRTSAEEIVNIVKMTSHFPAIFKSPLCSLALYCATTVYIYLAKENPECKMSPLDISNLEIVICGMEAISRHHKITNSFLQQACLDIERNGLGATVRISALSKYREFFGEYSTNIPLLARSSVSKHSTISPVLPGKLPLGNPQGLSFPGDITYADPNPQFVPRGTERLVKELINADCYRHMLGPVSRNVGIPKAAISVTTTPTEDSSSHKRKRREASPGIDLTPATWDAGFTQGIEHKLLSTMDNNNNFGNSSWKVGEASLGMRMFDNFTNFILPDRSTPSATSSPAYRNNGPSSGTGTGTDFLSPNSGNSIAVGLGNTPEENHIDFTAFQDRISRPIWPDEMGDPISTSQLGDTVLNKSILNGIPDSWGFITEETYQWQNPSET